MFRKITCYNTHLIHYILLIIIQKNRILISVLKQKKKERKQMIEPTNRTMTILGYTVI